MISLVKEHAQPAIIACAIGAYEIFKAAGFEADAFAGHSLVNWQRFTLLQDMDTLCELVCHRSVAMSRGEGGSKKVGTMAAIIGKNASSVNLKLMMSGPRTETSLSSCNYWE